MGQHINGRQHISIIGGSGFVGRAIVHEAIRRGHRVTVACRHPERARDLLVDGVRLVKADVVDGKGLDEAVTGADCAIYLVGLLFEKGRDTFEAAHVHGAEHAMEACKRAGVRRWLHMSALGAGNVPASKYARTKGEAEGRVRQSGLDWTIFRPSVIYGANDSFFVRFKHMARLMPVVPVIAGETRFQPVWVHDVARAFVDAAERRKTIGQTYELGGPKAYAFRELLELLYRELGWRRLLLPVPMPLARIMAAFAGMLPNPPLTRDQLTLLAHDNVVQGPEPFPAIFGKPASLEIVLPTYIHASRAEQLQMQLNAARSHYRKGGA